MDQSAAYPGYMQAIGKVFTKGTQARSCGEKIWFYFCTVLGAKQYKMMIGLIVLLSQEKRR